MYVCVWRSLLHVLELFIVHSEDPVRTQTEFLMASRQCGIKLDHCTFSHKCNSQHWSKTHHRLIGFLCQALTYYLSSSHRKSSLQTTVKREVRSFQHFANTLLFSTSCLVTACVQTVSPFFPVLICLALGTQMPVLSHRQALPVQQGF